MNLNQQLWLKSLDPDQMYGTLQRVLMEENLSVVPFEAVQTHNHCYDARKGGISKGEWYYA